jgi:hypothetical protein
MVVMDNNIIMMPAPMMMALVIAHHEAACGRRGHACDGQPQQCSFERPDVSPVPMRVGLSQIR